MTTTAHEDQFTAEPEPVRQQYSTADILRRNVADLELALKQQAERITDMAAALDRSHKRSTDLLKQCRDHDARRTAAVAQVAGLAAEVDRLNELHNRPIRVCEACAIYPCRCE